MENSWQRKCASVWPSMASSVVSSSQEPPQNQVFSAGYNFCSSIQAKQTSSAHRMAPEVVLPWSSSVNSYNLDHVELGSSLSSLLSGPLCITPAEVAITSRNASGLLCQNAEAGSDLYTVLSSKARVSANHDSKSGPSNVLQDAHMNIERLELLKAGRHQNLSSNENGPLFPSLRVGYVNGSIPSNASRLYSCHNTGPLHIPDPSVSCSSSTLTTDSPRVFCLNLSGDLLLSNTGLLGVVCSCHGFHMSVSKFSEHSGLCNVNPGDAVHLDSGESIAQWRKVYFHKFGIKTPEENCGWDWPEGLSVTGGLVKSFPTPSAVSKNSNLSIQDGSLASMQSFNLSNGTGYPKNFQSVQKVPDQFALNEKQRNAQEYFSSSLKNNLHSVAENQKIMYVMSGGSAMSNVAGVRGPDIVCSKSGDPFILHTHLQNLKTLDKDTSIERFSGSLVQRDMVSSNVELRLGQPSQQGQTSGSSIQPTLGSRILGAHRHSQNNFFLEQHVPKGFSGPAEDRRQHGHLASCISSSSKRTEESQLGYVNQICGASNAVPNAYQIEQLKGDAASGSFVSHLNSPLDRRIYSKSTNEVISGCHVMVSKRHSEYSILNHGQFGFHRGKTSDREFSSELPSSHKHENHENGGFSIGSSLGAAELSFGSHAKSKGRMLTFSRGESSSLHKVYSAGKDESTVMCHFSGGMTNESGVGNINYLGQSLYPAQNGEVISDASRSFSSAMDFRKLLPTQAVPWGFSATNHGIQNLTPLSKKQNVGGGPKLLDENVNKTAVQHVPEFYTQNHPTTSFKAIPEQDRSSNFCGKSVSDKRVNEMNYGHLLKNSEVASQWFQSANFLSSENTKSPSVPDKLCNFSVLPKVRYSHGKDAEIQNRIASDVQSTRQLFLRLGGTESISPSSEAGKCPQGMLEGGFPSKNNFPVQTNSLMSRYDQRGKAAVAECKDQHGNTGNWIATLLGPKLGENCTFAENVDSFNHKENMKQNTKQADCNSFLWRDVPRKVVTNCSLVHAENSVDSSNGNVEFQDAVTAEAAQKCFNVSANDVRSSKVQEISNVSSGCSAPVVTQGSVEVNNKDSSTVDSEDARYAESPVVDEGSGIGRCWSSDEGVDSERNVEFSKCDLGHKRPSRSFLSKPHRSLIDELRFRDSLRLRKLQKHSHTGNCSQEKGSPRQKYETGTKIWKRRPVKCKKLTSSFSPSTVFVLHNDTSEFAGNAELCPHSVKDAKMLSSCGQGKFEDCLCAVGQNIKQKSMLSLSTDISQNRDICRIHHVEEDKTNMDMDLNACSGYSEAMGRKRLRQSSTSWAFKQIHAHRSISVDSEAAIKETPIHCNMISSQPGNISPRPRRPVIGGKYGVITNANSSKPAKIVSLRKLLAATKKCRLADAKKVDLSSIKLLKKTMIKGRNGSFNKTSKIKEEVNGNIHHAVHNEMNPQHSMDEMKTACSIDSKKCDNLSHVMKKRRCGGIKFQATPDGCQITELRRKCKEGRKRSLHELSTEENHSSYVKFPTVKNVKSIPLTKSRFRCKLVENAEADKISANEICNAKVSTKDDKCKPTWHLNVFCCVCGSSGRDETNNLLECNGCLIKVHQACYGISKVPKANWYCRPCKTNSKNIACVLCGYGGGAMTRALRSHNIVKSLIRARNIMAESTSMMTCSCVSSENQIKMLSSSNSVREGNPILAIRPALTDLPSVARENKEIYKNSVSILSPSPASVAEYERGAISKTAREGEEQDKVALSCDSIIAGILDSNVKQWVHMVCGLWTPETRCPNVDTMSAFDVSGVCIQKPDVVCSVCERPGGSCIQCRVVGCNVRFHPWCAHQKGLLQSEVEGDDDESVGFYGRCLHHSMNHHFVPDSRHLDSCNADPGEKKLTCARTEGYKGRKRDGIHYNLPAYSDDCGGSLSVSQEQLDAWIHINRQKTRRKGPLKLSTSEIERDCRKEYARYKQSRGWKHLVVYKSGIHGLGLYTSLFISRGAMVVEYVGEIVGLRVSDKREAEYQSGKKLQYKSACYFFKIDKEHIIDATRKGGIARFVNHSCQPNCVAEIISVRNVKKVVFFAERDIYPGEEITYDYHFNHEDEGKKIPCYCHSKNCRRYLN